VDRWCEARGLERGYVMSVARCWELARRWYPGRLDRDWTRAPADRVQAIFDGLGLDGEFWRLAAE
jgi:hypothetical protein